MSNYSYNFERSLGVLYAIGVLIPIISLESFGLDSFRYFFKYGSFLFVGTAFLLFLLSKNELKIKYDFLVVVILCALLNYIFFVSNFFSPYMKLELGFNYIGKIIFILLCVPLFTSENTRYYFVKSIYVSCVLIALISILFFIFQFDPREYMFLGFYSNKSIVFEQNVFGIFVFFGFAHTLSSVDRFKYVLILIFCVAIFASYYKTVWILSLVFYFIYGERSGKLFWFFVSLSALLFFYFSFGGFDYFSKLLDVDGLLTLSGRTYLWDIAVGSFFDSPLIGLGEGSISVLTEIGYYKSFTTYHNVIIDVMAISGIVGIMVYIAIVFCLILLIKDVKLVLKFMLLSAPFLSNTVYPLSPNPLGFWPILFSIYYLDMKLIKSNNTKNLMESGLNLGDSDENTRFKWA